jgi:hypothetical protein
MACYAQPDRRSGLPSGDVVEHVAARRWFHDGNHVALGQSLGLPPANASGGRPFCLRLLRSRDRGHGARRRPLVIAAALR